MTRLEQKLSQLKQQNKCAFVSYICAFDPNYETSFAILKNLPKSGVDIIELGIPFLDPAGDGPIIENASKRAIKSGATLKKTLAMVEEFRKNDNSTPIVLMGYYNPILKYGDESFCQDAAKSGVDALLIVDLPPEENSDFFTLAKKYSLNLIGLVAPTSNEDRIKKISAHSSGFLYLVSMLGITGTKTATIDDNKINLQKIRQNSNLPVVIGFGIKEPKQAAQFAKIGTDGVVVGSTFVKEINDNFLAEKSSEEIANNTLKKVQEFTLELNKL